MPALGPDPALLDVDLLTTVTAGRSAEGHEALDSRHVTLQFDQCQATDAGFIDSVACEEGDGEAVSCEG